MHGVFSGPALSWVAFLLAAHELLCSTARLDVADVAEPSATLREYAACCWLGRWPGLESVPMPSSLRAAATAVHGHPLVSVPMCGAM